jgi:hypothetical protein
MKEEECGCSSFLILKGELASLSCLFFVFMVDHIALVLISWQYLW